MTTNLAATIRRELELAWQNGYNAGTSGSLATREQIVQSGTEQVLKAIQMLVDANMYTYVASGGNAYRLVGDTKYEAALETAKTLREACASVRLDGQPQEDSDGLD